jgi:3-dehydroquinate synthetase
VSVAGLPERDRLRLERVLDRLGLPRRMRPVSVARLQAAMAHDKKRDRRIRWVLTPRIGHASVPRPIAHRLVQAAMLEVGARL